MMLPTRSAQQNGETWKGGREMCFKGGGATFGVLFGVFGERGLGEAPLGRQASEYCVDLADAFGLLLSRDKK